MTDANSLTEVDHWAGLHHPRIRHKLPSRLMPGSVTMCGLLRRYIPKPGMSVLEIGCAPGKFLAYAALKLDARTTGVDYSIPGTRITRSIHRHLGVDSHVVQGDLFHLPLARDTFDVVFSNGLIEHFEDPRPALAAHLEVLRPGGRLLVTVPNFQGIYGWLQKRFDPANLAIHNVDIMSPEALAELVKGLPLDNVQAFRTGTANPILVHWRKRLGKILGGGVWAGLTVLGRLQPFEIDALRSLVVITGVKKR